MTTLRPVPAGHLGDGQWFRCAGLPSALSLTVLAWSSAGCAKSGDSTSAAFTEYGHTNTPKDYCKLYSPGQIQSALGKPAKTGYADPAKAMEGCEWPAADGKGRVLVQVLNRGLWYDLSGGTGQHPVFGIGEKAYVGPLGTGGVQAGALAGDNFYLVIIDPAPQESVITDLLRDFVAPSAH